MKKLVMSLVGITALGLSGLSATSVVAAPSDITFEVTYPEVSPGYIGPDNDYQIDYSASGLADGEDIVHVSLNGDEVGSDYAYNDDGYGQTVDLVDQSVSAGDVYRMWVTRGDSDEVLGEGAQKVIANPTIKLAKTEITTGEINKVGVNFTGAGFLPNLPVSVGGEDGFTGASSAPYTSEPAVADSDGNVSGVLTPNYPITVPSEYDPADPDYLQVSIYGAVGDGAGNDSRPVRTQRYDNALKIVAGDYDPGDGDEEAPDSPVIETKTVGKGGVITGQAVPGAQVRIGWKALPADSNAKSVASATSANQDDVAPAGEVTVTADSAGKFSLKAPSEEGTFEYTAVAIVDGIESKPGQFTIVVQDDADEGDSGAGDDNADPIDDADDGADGVDDGSTSSNGSEDSEADEEGSAESSVNGTAESDGTTKGEASGGADGVSDGDRGIEVSPKRILAADFVDPKQGVSVLASGFAHGETIVLKVTSGPNGVEGITLKAAADGDGLADFTVYGTSSSEPEAYVGTYKVEVAGSEAESGDSALTGSFEVVSDGANAGGGDEDGDGTHLPRTGADLMGLIAGVGLLAIGAIAFVVTARRNRLK